MVLSFLPVSLEDPFFQVLQETFMLTLKSHHPKNRWDLT